MGVGRVLKIAPNPKRVLRWVSKLGEELGGPIGHGAHIPLTDPSSSPPYTRDIKMALLMVVHILLHVQKIA